MLAHRISRQSAAAHDARGCVIAVFIATTVLVWTTQQLLDLGPLFGLKAMLILAIGAVLIVTLAERYLESATFGSANRVTLARGAMVVLLLALIGEGSTQAGAWLALIVAALALALDGVDGWLARSRGDTSDFGARFDMETDALLILATAALAWQSGKAGPWILAAGLLRYVFVASAYLLPWMRRRLPKSQRRRTICVLGTLSLVVCLAPPLRSPISDLFAMAGLVLLSGSFAVDTLWLARAAKA